LAEGAFKKILQRTPCIPSLEYYIIELKAKSGGEVHTFTDHEWDLIVDILGEARTVYAMVVDQVVEEGPRESIVAFLEEVQDASERKSVIDKFIKYLEEVNDGSRS
jgi:hypothetical protein